MRTAFKNTINKNSMKTTQTNFLATLAKNDICNLVEEVKETLATGIHTADTKPVFTAADYWNLERSRKVRNGRRFLLA
jgi:hypothetical protein